MLSQIGDCHLLVEELFESHYQSSRFDDLYSLLRAAAAEAERCSFGKNWASEDRQQDLPDRGCLD